MIVLAADRFHVAPWELLAQSRAWIDMAIMTVNAERRAEHTVAARTARRAKLAQEQGRW